MKDIEISNTLLKFIDGDKTTDKEYKKVIYFIKMVIRATHKPRRLDEMEIDDICSICVYRLLQMKDYYDRTKTIVSAYFSTSIRNEVMLYFNREKKHNNLSIDETINDTDDKLAIKDLLEGDMNELTKEDYNIEEEVRLHVQYAYPILYDYLYSQTYITSINLNLKRYNDYINDKKKNIQLEDIAIKHGFEYNMKFRNMISKQRKDLCIYFKKKYNIKDNDIKIIQTTKQKEIIQKRKDYRKQWDLKQKLKESNINSNESNINSNEL